MNDNTDTTTHPTHQRRPARPANSATDHIVRPTRELRQAVALTVVIHFRGVWVPAEIGSSGVLELISRNVAEVRGFHHLEDIEAIVVEAVRIMGEIESVAAIAFRRPPRRRRPHVSRGEQFAFQFGDAA